MIIKFFYFENLFGSLSLNSVLKVKSMNGEQKTSRPSSKMFLCITHVRVFLSSKRKTFESMDKPG